MSEEVKSLKLFVIGNGFDLAHGLETDYNSFFNWYLNQSIDKAREVKDDSNSDFFVTSSVLSFDDELISLRLKNGLSRTDFIDRFKEENVLSLKSELISINFNAYFLNSIVDTIIPPQWGNIEYLYFLELERIFKNATLAQEENEAVKLLNSQLLYLTKKLEEYISESINQEIYMKEYASLIDGLSSKSYANLFLNFNYTQTFVKYLNRSQTVINIHGLIGNNENPIIFGLGDEYSEQYKFFENRNEDEYLKNVKSIKYLLSNQYSSLQKNIDIYDCFEVIILGHSCSISDRTLLKEIYNHDSCKSIDIYHYNGKESFTESLYGISRYFDNNQIMRNKVRDYDENLKMPQYSK